MSPVGLFGGSQGVIVNKKTGKVFTLGVAQNLARRWAVALPIGAAASAATFLLALGGVHLYSADRLQWLLLFPGALCGSLAMPAQLLPWTTYAFLAVSAARMPRPRPYLIALVTLFVTHVVIGLVTFELIRR